MLNCSAPYAREYGRTQTDHESRATPLAPPADLQAAAHLGAVDQPQAQRPLALAAGDEAFARAQSALGSGLGRLILLPLTFALFYHLCNGIRHLLWDAVLGLELRTVYRSGYLVLAASTTLTLGLWAYAYLVRGGAG